MESTLSIRVPSLAFILALPTAVALASAPPERSGPEEPPGGHPPATQWSDGTIGAEACSRCHQAEYRDWLATPHARASELLGPAEREDPACVGCHSTSLRSSGRGVQCESCHGAGGDYYPDFVMRDPQLAGALGLRPGNDKATCARCHTADTPAIEPFDFDKALLRVNHRKGKGPAS